MVRQSRLPAVLLTRPASAGGQFAAALRERFGSDLVIVASPLLVPVFPDATIPDGPFAAVIFTSAMGVDAAVRLGRAWPDVAWCVGDRTAAVARAAGFQARSARGDAAALIRAIVAAGQRGPLLHLRGHDSRGEVAATLTAAGIPTRDCIVYAQHPHPLTAVAAALMARPGPIVAPVFSPRTAALLSAARARSGLFAVIRLVALSPAVAQAFTAGPGDRTTVAAQPDAVSMLDAVAVALGTA